MSEIQWTRYDAHAERWATFRWIMHSRCGKKYHGYSLPVGGLEPRDKVQMLFRKFDMFRRGAWLSRCRSIDVYRIAQTQYAGHDVLLLTLYQDRYDPMPVLTEDPKAVPILDYLDAFYKPHRPPQEWQLIPDPDGEPVTLLPPVSRPRPDNRVGEGRLSLNMILDGWGAIAKEAEELRKDGYPSGIISEWMRQYEIKHKSRLERAVSSPHS